PLLFELGHESRIAARARLIAGKDAPALSLFGSGGLTKYQRKANQDEAHGAHPNSTLSQFKQGGGSRTCRSCARRYSSKFSACAIARTARSSTSRHGSFPPTSARPMLWTRVFWLRPPATPDGS